jgi:transposase
MDTDYYAETKKVPKAVPLAIRNEIISRYQQGDHRADIAADFGLHSRTVLKLCRRYQDRGEEGLTPDYARSGRQESEFPHFIWQTACDLRLEHPDWGASAIHQQLTVRYPEETLPSIRSLQRWFQTNGCNRRRGRPMIHATQVGALHDAGGEATE